MKKMGLLNFIVYVLHVDCFLLKKKTPVEFFLPVECGSSRSLFTPEMFFASKMHNNSWSRRKTEKLGAKKKFIQHDDNDDDDDDDDE